MGIGDETRQEIDGEVSRAPVTGVLDLRNVFELIGDGFDNEAFTQQKPVREQHQLTFHILAQCGHKF